MAVVMPAAKVAFFNSSGAPLVGGKVATYAAGTSTPKATYSDALGTVANANPTILDARGEATMFWSGSYKVELRDAADAVIWTVDNVIAVDSFVQVPDGVATLPSGTTVDLGSTSVRAYEITGTASIQSFGSGLTAGAWRFVRFLGAATLVYNATSMIIPGAANLTCAVGDSAIFMCDSPGNWRCVAYFRANDPIVGPTGNMRVGSGVPSASVNVEVSRNITGATTARQVLADGTVQPDVTARAVGFETGLSTAVSAFTLASLDHYRALQATIGSGSAVTAQNGFVADVSLVGAGTNYGFRGQLPLDGVDNWNAYHDGTAPNYFLGDVRVGSDLALGAVSNAAVISGGIHRTVQATYAGVATATPTDTLVLPNTGMAVWIVSAGVAGSADAANYNEVALITTQAGVSTLATLQNGTLMTIAMSGLTVRVTQSSGTSQTLTVTAIRIA